MLWPKVNSTATAVAWAFKLLDVVSVPGVAGYPAAVGGVPVPSDGLGDFTQWEVVRDHAERALYSRTWDNRLPKRVRLADLNLSVVGAPRANLGLMGAGAWMEDM
jgi:penicillin V acylase-like amidase (Ntn superfamily)